MPKKKKNELPSGSIRKQIYSHSEIVYDENGKIVLDPKTGKPKMKKIYISVKGKNANEVKAAAAAVRLKKESLENPENMTVAEAIHRYLGSSDSVLSPTTIHGYEIILKHAFHSLLPVRLKTLTNAKLREAVNLEAQRTGEKTGKPISSKTVVNEYGLLRAVLNVYVSSLNTTVPLPQVIKHQNILSDPEDIFRVVKGTSIELPVLLAMWLSLTESEMCGLYKSKAISPDGNYISIVQTQVKVGKEYITKETTKQTTRRRTHRIPPYIKELINKVPGDKIVTQKNTTLYSRFVELMKEAGYPHMTFHDLRHVNASVMAVLQIPDKYAQERGGWKTDNIMKSTYMQTFSSQRIRVDDTIDSYFE